MLQRGQIMREKEHWPPKCVVRPPFPLFTCPATTKQRLIMSTLDPVSLHVNAFHFSITARRVISPTWGPPPPCEQALRKKKEEPPIRTTVAHMCLSYLLMPPFLCLYIDSTKCPKDNCVANSKCVIDPLIPEETHCVCKEGFRKDAEGACVGKLNVSGLFLLCCSFLIKGERKPKSSILYGSLKLLRFEIWGKKQGKVNFDSRKWRKEPKTRSHFQNWTSAILNIFSFGYLHKRNVRRHVVTSQRTYIVQGNKILWRVESKLVGLCLISSLILLNPSETVRSQRKTMFTRVKMSAEEEINRSVYGSVVRSRELRRATRERMFMLQGDRGSRK